MFDFHMHTHFSPDASMTLKEAIESAVNKGLDTICITDHVDYDYDGEDNDFSINFDEYFKEIKKMQELYRGRIKIRTGVEFGLQPHLYYRYSKDVVNNPFDFILCSIHSVAKTDLYTGNFFDTRNQVQAYTDYYKDMKDIVENYEGYSVFGHLDVIKRYGAFDVLLPFHNYQDMVEDILKTIIAKGKGIEVNTSGIRYKLGDYHPSRDIIQLYHDLGGEIITIGSDAHKTKDIGFEFKKAAQYLQEIGFKHITTFQQLKPEFHPIEKHI